LDESPEQGRSGRFSVAELFCGCGGFSHGFSKSGSFDVVFGNDIKKAALRTFQVNHVSEHGQPEVIPDDIRVITVDQIVSKLEKRGLRRGTLDCLIGGPPCQGFSQMRRSEERKDNKIVKFKGYGRLDHDPRNDLVLRFLEIAAALNPKIIVVENVPQMLRHGHNGVLGGLAESVTTLLHEMGYDVAVDTLNAADYGVPQLRERVFFLASRIGRASLPMPTHADAGSSDFLFSRRFPWVTVSDAIRDLPPPFPGPEDSLGGTHLTVYPALEISEYAKSMRSGVCFPYNHVTRGYQRRILHIIREMKPGETWDHASERMRHRYEKLVEQRKTPVESKNKVRLRLIEQGTINPAFYQRYYWSAYTRLAWNRPALTITANANFLGSGRFTHPEVDRGITMREAARLQSFEDDFKFVTSGEDNDTASIGVGLDMIGEAVPPLLAEALARHIAQLLGCCGECRPTAAGVKEVESRRFDAFPVVALHD
jgi:DNA (cytosine-5)-methyltransferase 1